MFEKDKLNILSMLDAADKIFEKSGGVLLVCKET
jgi:hypothetical protein